MNYLEVYVFFYQKKWNTKLSFHSPTIVFPYDFLHGPFSHSPLDLSPELFHLILYITVSASDLLFFCTYLGYNIFRYESLVCLHALLTDKWHKLIEQYK